MKCKTQSWDNTGSPDAYNDWADEDNFIDAKIHHRFYEPAEVLVTLADGTGSMMQKYNVDDGDVYITSRIKLMSDDEGTTYFYGIILKAHSTENPARCVLHCAGPLYEHTLERIDFDMRLNLDDTASTYPRQGYFESILDDDIRPVRTSGSDYYFYDRDGGSDGLGWGWDTDEWNGKYVVIPDEIKDTTIETHPCSVTVSTSGAVTENGTFDDAWVDDSNKHEVSDSSDDWTEVWEFYAFNESGSLSHDVTGMRLKMVYAFGSSSADCELNVYDGTDYDEVLADIESNSDLTRFMEIEIPGRLLDSVINSGIFKIQFNVSGVSSATTLYVYYLKLEIDVTTDGYYGLIEVTDVTQSPAASGKYTEVKVDTDLVSVGLWEGCPYGIIGKINTYIQDIVQDNDPLIALGTTDITTSTSGATGRNYHQRTPLEILQDLAGIDGAIFWVPLGSTTFKYKQTTDASSSAITDADVLYWEFAEYDSEPMFNEYHIYGVRAGQNIQVSTDTSDPPTGESDPGTDSKDKYRLTKSKTIKATGTLSQTEAWNLAEALVERDEDVQLHLQAVLPGLSSYRLGDWWRITSTRLDLTNADYVISYWHYDHKNYRTTVRLHPRGTVGIQSYMTLIERLRRMSQQLTMGQSDVYIPTLWRQDWEN